MAGNTSITSRIKGVYLENVGDSGLGSQDEDRVRLFVSIISSFELWGGLPVLRPKSNVHGGGWGGEGKRAGAEESRDGAQMGCTLSTWWL